MDTLVLHTPRTVLSFFIGVGGFDRGFAHAGFTIVGQVENDPAASSVLARDWRDVPNYGDITHVHAAQLPEADVWVGGFPCQDLSVAGRRAGLAGARSGLFFAWHRLLRSRQPGWVVIENVPSLLSSNGGRDFAVVLGGLTGRLPAVPARGWANTGFARGGDGSYHVAWRVLDALSFGVPQRRRRLFLVADRGDGRCAEVLFERAGGGGHPPAYITAGAPYARMLAAGVGGASDGDLIASVAENQRGEVRMADYAPALIAAGGGKPGSGYSAVLIRTPGGQTRVRRLTPREYERLQGFPDDGTAGQSDHTRYAQMGNAVCVKVVAWLAQRLMASLVAQEAPAAAGQVAH